MKEKTSTRLTDLLKKSPVKIFKESQSDLNNICDSDAHDVEHTQSIVGRRLSTADMLPISVVDRRESEDFTTPPQLARKLSQCDSDCVEKRHSLEMHRCGLDHINSNQPQPSPSIIDMASSEDVWVRSTEGEDKSSSLTRSEGRNSRRLTCYSSDNLADVDENDYENVDFGDSSNMEQEEIIYHPPTSSTPKVDDNLFSPSSEETCNPPLPPLPEFLLRKRLMNTMSCLDNTLSSLELFKNKINKEDSCTSDGKLRRSGTDFWQALDKYFETGKIDQVATPNHRPLASSEPSTPITQEDNHRSKTTRYDSHSFMTMISSCAIRSLLLLCAIGMVTTSSCLIDTVLCIILLTKQHLLSATPHLQYYCKFQWN